MFLDAQKNRPIDTVLLSTDNICLDTEIRNLTFNYTGDLFGLSVV